VRRVSGENVSQLFRVEQTEKTSDDYLTPRWVFDALGLEFDLDVAAPPWETHVPATRKFTKADDGLTQPWEGRVWMNPPYSNATPWVRKFIEHAHGICLVPHAKSGWHRELWDAADGICDREAFAFDGGWPFLPVFFAAFGDECVAALEGLGRVR
jgi:hypothetical protein